MEQNEHEKKENWQGALHSQWKEDAAISPALNWEQLSPRVMKKNRKRIGWWWGMTFLLVGMLMSVLYFNISSDESAVGSDEFASASLVKNDSLSQSD